MSRHIDHDAIRPKMGETDQKVWNRWLGKQYLVEDFMAMARVQGHLWNVVNLATAFATLVRVKGGLRKDVVLLQKYALHTFKAHPEEVEPRHVATVLWACAKFGCHDDSRPLQKLMLRRALEFGPSAFKQSEISLIIWSLGKLKLEHKNVWTLALSLTNAFDPPSERSSIISVSNVLYGLGLLVSNNRMDPAELPSEKLWKIFISFLPSMSPVEISNSLGGCAKLKLTSTPPEWPKGLAEVLVSTTHQALPQHTANIMWAVAKLKEDIRSPIPSDLKTALGVHLEERLITLGPQEISMCMWASAAIWDSTSSRAKSIVRDMEPAIESHIDVMNGQQLATCALAFAKLDGASLTERLAGVSAVKMSRFSQQDVENVVSALAHIERPHEPVETAAMARVMDFIHAKVGWQSRHLANIVWGLGKLASIGPGAMAAERSRISRHLPDVILKVLPSFNPRDLANCAWGLAALGICKKDLFKAIGDMAAQNMAQFNAQECSKLLYAFKKAGVKCPQLESAATDEREEVISIPHLKRPVKLTQIIGGGRSRQTQREATGTTGATGGALWQDSPLLAEWLAKCVKKGLPNQLREFLGKQLEAKFISLRGHTAVELGAGLGLPSIVASQLGVKVIATDGDQVVLDLLNRNANTNSPRKGGSLTSELLPWGEGQPLQALKLDKKPDLIFGSGIVYGKDDGVWKSLASTLRELCSTETLIIMAHGNGAAPGVHQLKGKFYEALGPAFQKIKLDIPEFAEKYQGCQLHALRLVSTARSERDEQGHSQNSRNEGSNVISASAESADVGKSKLRKEKKSKMAKMKERTTSGTEDIDKEKNKVKKKDRGMEDKQTKVISQGSDVEEPRKETKALKAKKKMQAASAIPPQVEGQEAEKKDKKKKKKKDKEEHKKAKEEGDRDKKENIVAKMDTKEAKMENMEAKKDKKEAKKEAKKEKKSKKDKKRDRGDKAAAADEATTKRTRAESLNDPGQSHREQKRHKKRKSSSD